MPEQSETRWLRIEGNPISAELLVCGLSGYEEIGHPYEYWVDLESPGAVDDVNDLLGQPLRIAAEVDDSWTRWFCGVVRECWEVPSTTRFRRFCAIVVPTLWLLSRRADCRIFQEQSVEEIISTVLREGGVSAFEFRLNREYPKREYCVQYRETHLNFIERLMQAEGMYYFFQHESERETMIIADSPSAHEAVKGYESVPCRSRHEGAVAVEHAWDVQLQHRLHSATVALTDYDYLEPQKVLSTEATAGDSHTLEGLEVFDAPGGFAEAPDGEHYAKVRSEELATLEETVEGLSDAKGLTCGCTVELTEMDGEDESRPFLLSRTEYQLDSNPRESVSDRGGEPSRPPFIVRFVGLPATHQFRPARAARVPIVHGPQTAVVVGPSGQEIYSDDLGRVKVQFRWDRYGGFDERSSCWIRVGQLMAGNAWGGLHVPRIGHEVVVEFLEGDPDRPLIVGSVYNGTSRAPYDLKTLPTMITLKSNSSKGGGGFNELRLDDKKGEEQVFVHGEKNLDIRIKNDAFELIGNDRHLIVKKDQIEHVENNREELVDNDHKEKIGKDRHLKVVGKEAKEVGNSLSLTVKDDVIEVFKKNQSTQVTKDLYIKAANICIEATTNITIKVGQTYIAIEASGISIGTKGEIKIESTGPTEVKSTAPLKLESSAKADLKSPMSTVAGDGMLTLKGGLVKIN